MAVRQIRHQVPTYGRGGPGTGPLVDVPPRVEADVWAAFACQVVVLDDADPTACHLWMGRLHGATGYGEFTYRPHPTIRRLTGAHRFAYTAFFDLPEQPAGEPAGPADVVPLPGMPVPPPPRTKPDAVHVRHRCDERLCTPVTAAKAAAHLQAGDAVSNAIDRENRGRGARRRFGIRRLGSGHVDGLDRTQVSLQLQAAIRTNMDLGMPAAGLLAAVDQVYDNADPYRDQLAVIPLPSRRSMARLRRVQ